MANLLRLVACLSLCVSLNTVGGLQPRDFDGDLSTPEAFYDDVLDITWLRDMHILDTIDYYDNNFYSGTGEPISTDNTNCYYTNKANYEYYEGGAWGPNGDYFRGNAFYELRDEPDRFCINNLVSYSIANNYIQLLTSNWRLPSLNNDAVEGVNRSGELAHMFYNNLNSSANSPLTTVSFIDAYGEQQSFSNYISNTTKEYWYQTDWQGRGWVFDMTTGSQKLMGVNHVKAVWLVHDGDVGTPLGVDTPAIITGDTQAILFQGSGFASGTLTATDINGLTDGTYFTVSSNPISGFAVINPSSGAWSYFPSNPNFTGQVSFDVTITDDLGGATVQIINVTITADSDSDGAYDHQDNCPSVSNTGQEDLDEDGAGDACDNDKDGDGFTSDHDYNDLNAYLSTDPDNDGVDSSGTSHYSDNVCLRSPQCNENGPCITVCYIPPQDNCPTLVNPDQSNIDGDAEGDACDLDIDGDLIRNSIETAYGTDPNDPNDGDAAELAAIESSTEPSKNVPAMGSIGLLALGLSMLGLGAVRLRRK